MPRDDRRMTFIVVPHGGRDLGTRSFEVSYRRLRLVGVLLLVAAIVWVVMAASWVYVAAQAARVPHLQAEVARLESERVKEEQLAEVLRRLESRYEQLREMLGADRPREPGSVWLPPADASGSDPAPAPAKDSVQAFLPTAWPLTERGFITRGHLGRVPGQHRGIDVAVAPGSYVRAAAPGVVEEAGFDSVYGNFVKIRHSGGYESLYGHAAKLFVAPRDSVARHEVIALSGSTGLSTAPHLHFEILKNGKSIDPTTLVQPPSP